MKSQAFANRIRTGAVTAFLIAFAASGPAAHAQLAPGGPTARVAVNRDFLIGSWSDEGDCTTSVAFSPDGGYATADGTEGHWSLAGDTLTLSGEAGATTLTIVPIDHDTMEVIGQDGSHDRSTRCAGDLGNVHFDDLRVA